jgi:ankyrin repeat protein
MRRPALLVALAATLLATFPAQADLNLFGDYYRNIPRAVEQNDVATVQTLLADGVTPQQLDDKNRTGLHIAAQNGNIQIFAILVKFGARLDVTDSLGNTPLHYAAERDRIEMVKLMVELHAPVDADNKAGITPLMLAAGHGNIEVVQTLLAAGANPRKTDFTGHDALSFARDSRKSSTVQLIERAATTGKR